MRGKERCGMARSADGASDKLMIASVMLRFRPIAPKPASDGDKSGKSTSDPSSKIIFAGKAKRKYVRARKNQKKIIPNPSLVEENNGVNEKYRSGDETLQLLPERFPYRSYGEDPLACTLSLNHNCTASTQASENRLIWFNSEENRDSKVPATVSPGRLTVDSVVTVEMECVTDALVDGRELGLTDVDRIKNLGEDTCPGFISNGCNSVQWVNEAYSKTVRQGEDRELQWPVEVRVWLAVNDRLPRAYAAFACRVRWQYTWHDRNCSRILPCDVWRMDGGGFAWRLDVKAALSLSI